MTAVVSFACGVAMSVTIAVVTLAGCWWIARYDNEDEGQ